MRVLGKHIGRLLLSIAFILAIGNQTFAIENWDEGSLIQFDSLVEESELNLPIEINNFSLVKTSQTIPAQEYTGAAWLAFLRSENGIVFTKLSSQYTNTYYLEDQRRSIARYLYPFHFHW